MESRREAAYSRDLCAALVEAVESQEDGLCVAQRGGRVLYQNAAFRRMTAGEDATVLKNAIRDAQRAAVARMASRQQSALFAVEAHSSPNRYRVRCTVVGGTREGRRKETLVLWLTRNASHRMSLNELRRRFALTDREGRVATLIEAGATTREIAHTLGISVHTARRHAEALMRKLGAHSRMEVRARMHGSA